MRLGWKGRMSNPGKGIFQATATPRVTKKGLMGQRALQNTWLCIWSLTRPTQKIVKLLTLLKKVILALVQTVGRFYSRLLPQGREMGFNSEYNGNSWGFIAKKQREGEWMENCEEETSKVGERKKVKLFSCVQLFVTPWTVACQAPLSMGFSRQEYWSGLTFPSPGDLPNPGNEPRSPTLQADTLSSEPPGKPPEVGDSC